MLSVICEQWGMDKPRVKEICEAAGISKGYASDIRSGRQAPSRPLAIYLFRKLGWRHQSIGQLTDQQLAASEILEPWVPVQERA